MASLSWRWITCVVFCLSCGGEGLLSGKWEQNFNPPPLLLEFPRERAKCCSLCFANIMAPAGNTKPSTLGFSLGVSAGYLRVTNSSRVSVLLSVVVQNTICTTSDRSLQSGLPHSISVEQNNYLQEAAPAPWYLRLWRWAPANAQTIGAEYCMYRTVHDITTALYWASSHWVSMPMPYFSKQCHNSIIAVR